MTEKDLMDLMYAALRHTDSNFEFWLSASFAVILVFHFAGSNLTRLMYRLVLFLYVSATVLFVTRWLIAAMQYADFRQRLIDMGSTIKVSSIFAEGIVTVGYAFVILAGAIGTVYYGYRTFKNVSESRP